MACGTQKLTPTVRRCTAVDQCVRAPAHAHSACIGASVRTITTTDSRSGARMLTPFRQRRAIRVTSPAGFLDSFSAQTSHYLQQPQQA